MASKFSIVPRSTSDADAAIDADVRRANARLPDYARIAFWIRADAPFSAADGSATANGRVRRDAAWSRYRERLEPLYEARSGVERHVLL